MKRTQINLDEKTYYQLISFARKEKTSLSGAVRTLVSEQLNQQKDTETNNPLLELAKLGEKLHVKGPKDLSVNHDYYLYVEPYLTPKQKKKGKADKKR